MLKYILIPVKLYIFPKFPGWCSAHPRLTIDKYGIPCQDLSVGDVCLPPNHPEAVRTPDLCDRFRRFDFAIPASASAAASEDKPQPPPPPPPSRGITTTTTSKTSKASSPPASPSKPKKERDPDKPKRPMNGFMLFAKKYRLELIQQHPGKDNR